MAFTVSPTDSDVFSVLRSFLIEALGSDFEVILGQINRVPEPSDDNFAVFWPTMRSRIETNIDAYGDVTFTASIAGTLMTVTDVQMGTIEVGAQVFGTGLSTGTSTVITALVGGTGGTGTYRVTPSQTVGSQPMASGGATFMQPTQLVCQIDVHGPLSGNNAQIISTLLRDPYGVEKFAELNANVYPLLADDPRQIPFQNEQQQWEYKWVIECLLQVNQTVRGAPQQFADSYDLEVIEVEAAYPPT